MGVLFGTPQVISGETRSGAHGSGSEFAGYELGIKGPSDGGMCRYMDDLALARLGFTLFLLALQIHQGNNAPEQIDGSSSISRKNYIRDVHSHQARRSWRNFVFAWKVKQLILSLQKCRSESH